MQVSSDNLKIINEEALRQYPHEAVIGIKDEECIIYDNIHHDPENNFKVDTITFYSNVPDILIHSHTNNNHAPRNVSGYIDPRTPSKLDMITQDNLQIPFGIVGCDGENVSEPIFFPDFDEELYGRTYIHGVYDCYTIIQSFYKQKLNIELMSVAREYLWWDGGESLYDKYYSDAGFYEVSEEDIQYGDMILIKLSCAENNHGCVYLGDNKILQHMNGRTSQEYSFSKWRSCMTKFLRHKDMDKNNA